MTTPPQPQPGGYPEPGPYPPPAIPGQPHGFYPPPPPKKSFWSSTGGILTIVFGSIGLVVLLCAGLVIFGVISDRIAASKIDAKITSCESNGMMAKIGYSVTNNGSSGHRVTLDIEYRDSSGARLDTDTARVGSVPAGDTVRGEEFTVLNASATAVTCKIVKIH